MMKLKFIQWKEEWDFHYNYQIICLSKNTMVGSVTLSVSENNIKIVGMYIQPEFRGQGVGTKLMEELEKIYLQFTMVYLKVRRDNKEAIKLYEKFGFEFDSIDPPGIYQWMYKK